MRSSLRWLWVLATQTMRANRAPAAFLALGRAIVTVVDDSLLDLLSLFIAVVSIPTITFATHS